MRVCAYCRVSTDSEEQEKSYEAQKSYFNREIIARGHELFEVYGDEGETGTKLNNREQFNQMLYDAGIDIVENFRSDAPKTIHGNLDRRVKKKHLNYEESERRPLFDEIWIKNTSRFARNTLSFQIVEKLRNKGVHIYFIEQNINTREVSADFLLKLFQLFDEQESRDKSSKVAFGKTERAKSKGTIATNKKIYGYSYIKEGNSLSVIEDEAVVVRLMYQLYLDGYGVRRIINHLTDKKIFTRQGKPFSASSVKRILSNEKYCGTNVRNKYTYGRVFSKHSYAHIKDPAEWIVQVDHERIPKLIDKATFEAVQAKFKSNAHHQNQRGVYKGVSQYAGLVYCASCGAVYHSNIDRGRRFYNCSNKRHNGAKTCSNPNVSEIQLNKRVSQASFYLNEWKNIARYKKMLNDLKHLLSKQLSTDDAEKVTALSNTLGELQAKKDRYVELYSDSFITKEELAAKVEPLNKSIAETEYSIAIRSKHNTELSEDISEVLAAQTFLDDEDKRMQKELFEKRDKSCLLEEVDKIIVNADGIINIVYNTAARLEKLFSKHQKLYDELKKQ